MKMKHGKRIVLAALSAALMATTMATPAHAAPGLAFALFTLQAPLFIVNAVAGVGIAGTILSTVAVSALTAALSYGASLLLNGQSNIPKSQDGKFNLKQNVPDRVRVYGTVRKGGDYVFG